MIYRHSDLLGSKLAIILQEPLRSTVPFIPSCVTREKYFTAWCAKPRRVSLQPTSQATVCEPLLYGLVAKLAEDTLRNYCGALNCCVITSAQDIQLSRFYAPLLIKNWERHFVALFFKTLWLCTSRCIWRLFILPSTYKGMGEGVLKSDQKSLDSCTNHDQYVPIILPSTYRGMGEAFW